MSAETIRYTDKALDQHRLPTVVIGPPEHLYQLSLAGDSHTGLLHLGINIGGQPPQTTTAVAVAPMLALIARDLDVQFVGGPPLNPDTYIERESSWRLKAAATGDRDVVIATGVTGPGVTWSVRGNPVIHPSNHRTSISFGIADLDPDGYKNHVYASFSALDVVAVLCAHFTLNFIDIRGQLTRHLSPPLPSFEVLEDRTTRLVPTEDRPEVGVL